MAYSVKDDVLEQMDEDILLQLTDDHDTGVVDDDKVTRAIADADASIDTYCQGRYSIPLSPVPDKIRQVSVDISIYNLYSRRGDTVPENRKDRHKEALRFLEKVSEGKISLGSSTPAETTTTDTANIDYNDRIFTRGKMSGF